MSGRGQVHDTDADVWLCKNTLHIVEALRSNAVAGGQRCPQEKRRTTRHHGIMPTNNESFSTRVAPVETRTPISLSLGFCFAPSWARIRECQRAGSELPLRGVEASVSRNVTAAAARNISDRRGSIGGSSSHCRSCRFRKRFAGVKNKRQGHADASMGSDQGRQRNRDHVPRRR